METLTIQTNSYDNYNNQAWALLWNGMYYQFNGNEWVPYPYTTTTVGGVATIPIIEEDK